MTLSILCSPPKKPIVPFYNIRYIFVFYYSLIKGLFFTIPKRQMPMLTIRPMIPEWMPLTRLQSNAIIVSVTTSPATNPVIENGGAIMYQ